MERLLLGTADPDDAGGGLGAAWLVTAAALLLAGIGRRRLPAGVSGGLFVGGLSAALLLNYLAWGEMGAQTPLFSAGPVSLAVVWLIVAVWIERGDRSVRGGLATHAVAVAALLVLPSALTGGEPAGPWGLVVRLLLLFGVAGGLYLRRRDDLTRGTMLAVAIGGGLLLVRDIASKIPGPVLPTAVLAGGTASLIVVIGVFLHDWRRRVCLWWSDLRRLTDPAPPHRALYGFVLAGCVLVGAGGALRPEHALSPAGVILAAYAALTVGHCWRSNIVGEVGLALVGEAIVLAPLAWLPASRTNLLLGLALAGVFLLWLARFWAQQLCDGRPWTTTGRLIPAARNLSLLAAGGQVLTTGWLAWASPDETTGPWSLTAALVLMLLQGSYLIRDARERGDATTALAACLVIVAALVPAHHLAVAFRSPLPPALWLAVAAVVLALRTGPRRPDDGAAWAFDAYLGALLPLAVAYAAAMPDNGSGEPLSAVAALFGAALAAGLRFGRRRPRLDASSASQP